MSNLTFSAEDREQVLAIIDSGEPFILIAGHENGHMYHPHTQNWRETLGLIEVAREVARWQYREANKSIRKARKVQHQIDGLMEAMKEHSYAKSD